MANFNKVVKVLNIKSAASLQLTGMEKAQSRVRDNSLNGISNALSRSLDCARAEVNCQLLADFIFKTFITLLKLAIGR